MKQENIQIRIPAGTSQNSSKKELEKGKIIGVVVFTNLNQSGAMVRLGIKDVNQNEITKLVPVDYYKQRNTNYHESYLPLSLDGGQDITVNVISNVNLVSETFFDTVFIYEQNQY